MIFQELSVLPNLNVAENLFLAKEKKKGDAARQLPDGKKKRKRFSKAWAYL